MNNNNDSGNTSAVEINTARLVESAVAKTVESSVESNDKAVETTDKTAKMAKKPIIYGSQEECAEREGVGKYIIRLAKNKGAPGFQGTRVCWDILKPWLDKHKEELSEETGNSLLKWKTKKEKHLANLAEIQEAEARNKYLLKNEVESQVKAIALAQKALLKSKLTGELPSKLLGLSITDMSIILEATVNEICRLMMNMKIK